MSAKASPARRAAFLRAVAETGNQTLAAERAKVSRSWVRLHRKGDPGFDAAVRAAIEEARERLRGDPARARDDLRTRKPPAGWGFLDGAELVVKGTGGSGGGKRIQIARARLRQWTPRVERRFLAALLATCNVRAACAEAGMTPASAYAHRKRWPRFASLWEAAVEEGYARLEIALVENGLNLFGETDLPPEMPLRGMDAALAIHVLHMHKNGVVGIGRAPGRQRLRPPGMSDPAIVESIRRKVAAIRAADAIPEAVRAADRRAYARRRSGSSS